MRTSIPNTLPEILDEAVAQFPQSGINYVRADKTIRHEPYPELKQHALSLLAALQERGIGKGDPVILSLDLNEEIIPVLWACFYGGIVPALLQPPNTFTEYNPAAEKAVKVYHRLGTPHVILSHSHYESWFSANIPQNRLIDVAGLSGNAGDARPAMLQPEDLALIQFSSGSTGDPKGVMLSHRNILINTEDITRGIHIVPEDVSVSWMPLFHDMGLIGFHFAPVYNGANHFTIETIDFVKNPSLWLDMMSEQRANITGCPNFGQALVNRYLGRKKGAAWNLEAVRIIFNGAEPISVPTMNEFVDGLAPHGLNPVAMFPAYGMAEATLAITFSDPLSRVDVVRFRRLPILHEGVARLAANEDSNAIELVNLGKPLDHCSIRVVNESGEIVPESMLGNVEVKGENVTSGYYGDPARSVQAIHDGWLKTGDLGFIHQGDLFITGRSKDIIFINGANYYAHDLETIAMQVEEVNFGKLVVAGYFDETDGHDKLLVFLVGADNESTLLLFKQLKQKFLSTIGLTVNTFIPIKSNEIPRTSSGKIQRFKMVDRFLKGEFLKVINL